jgi:8-oxo-dGTP pyrophosphatase MutT (NUDIX family)
MPGAQQIPRPAGARPAGPALWEALGPGERKAIGLHQVVEAIRAHVPTAQEAVAPAEVASIRPAAVLIPLFEEDGETRVVLTRRSSSLRSHTGEVAFPGGRIEGDEDPLDAALREADEEVAIAPHAVTIVGRLNQLTTVGRPALVTPFVGTLAGRPVLRPNPAEVELAFDVALADLAADGVHSEEVWELPGRPAHHVHFFDLPHDMVWGATGRLLYDLLTLVISPPLLPQP